MNRIQKSLLSAMVFIAYALAAPPAADTTPQPVPSDSAVSIQTSDSTATSADSMDSVSPSAAQQIDTAGYTVYDYDTHRNSYTITSQPKDRSSGQPVSPGQPIYAPVQQPYSSTAPPPPLAEKPVSAKPRINDYTKINIQNQLKSAKQLATGGAVVYGLGFGIEVIGIIILINELSNVSSTYDPYYGYSYDEPSYAGLYIALIGGVTSLGGTIASNMGGSRARIYYSTIYNDAPAFNGWIYFGASIGCSVGGTILSMAEVPIVPSLLSLTGFIFGLSSVVHSCNYSSKLYIKSLVISDVKCSPLIDLSRSKSIGLSLACNFGLDH
jgi:hypothetical protein